MMNRHYKKAYMEITNVCNLDCSFCPGTTREKRFLSVKEAEELAGQIKGVCDYVYLHLMGEPLLHPQFLEIVKACQAKGLKVAITTNGVLLPRLGEGLLELHPYKISVSLHSFEANGGEDLDGYLKGVLDFARRAEKQGETILCLRLWNGGGAEEKNGMILRRIDEAFPKREGERLGSKIFLELADRFDWPGEGETEGEPRFCYGLRDQFGILCDGTVVPCCLDADGRIPLGNAFRQPLAEILEGERARNLYEGFSRGTAREELCKNCSYARRF